MATLPAQAPLESSYGGIYSWHIQETKCDDAESKLQVPDSSSTLKRIGDARCGGVFIMFGFFKKRSPADPPTEKQRRYAAKIGIEVQPKMTKAEVSAAIADAERRNPATGKQRARVKTKMREKKFGKELIDQEDRWNQFATETEFMLAVYTGGKETIVDVLRVNEAFVNDHGKLKLGVEAPKIVRDHDVGDYLDWDKHFEMSIESLLYHEPLCRDFHARGIGAYQKIVEKGLTIARKL